MTRGRSCLVAAAVLVLAPGLAGAVDIRTLIRQAQEQDLRLKRALLAADITRNGIAREAAGRGLELGVGTSGGGPLALSTDLGAGPFNLTVSATPQVELTLPEPVSTQISLGVPLSLSVPSAVFTPELSLGATQPLSPLVGASAARRLRELEEALALERNEASIRARRTEVALDVISSLKLLEELKLEIADLEQELEDIADEEARALALDPEAPTSPAGRQLAQRRAATEEGIARARRALELREARLVVDLGEGAAEPAQIAVSAPVPPQGANGPSVRVAEMEAQIARARLEQHEREGFPSLTARAGFGLAEGSVPVSLTLGIWLPVLDGGSRRLGREALELAVEDREIALEIARAELEETLLDLRLEAESLVDRVAAARRAQEAAREDHRGTVALAEAGIRSARELERSAYSLDRRGVELRLLDFDLLSFEYRVAGLGIE